MMTHPAQRIETSLEKTHRLLVRTEKSALCLLLFSMIILSFSQVITRNFFSFGFVWANEVLRLQVIWIAFIGAALATEQNRHIRIDIVSRLIHREATQRVIDILTGLFTAAVSLLLFIAAIQYIGLMRQYVSHSVFFGFPDWTLRLVIPYSFAAMAIRCGRVVYINTAEVKNDT